MQDRDEFDSPGIRDSIASVFDALGRKQEVAPRRPLWAVAIVLALVLFLGSVLWYSYPREVENREIMAVPIVRADAGQIKVVPADPGGMDIPHRDSTIFETLRADTGSGAAGIENLLDDAEEPLSRDQIFAGLRTEVKVEGRAVMKTPDREDVSDERTLAGLVPATEDNRSEGVPAVTPAAEPAPSVTAAASQAMPVPGVKPAPVRAVVSDNVESDAAEIVSRTEPAAGVEIFEKPGALSAAGGYFVQFASLRSNDAAENAWRDLQKSLNVLRPLPHRVQAANLGAKGTFYRLQAGPFTESRAREVCAAVEAQRPGGCLVVKN